jgi:FixJ family two-component response regulator
MTGATKVRQAVTVSEVALERRCAKGRVALIDDDADFLAALAALVEIEGYACDTYSSALAYLESLKDERPCFPGPCCVVCDIQMPDLSGLELQQRLYQFGETPLLLMSGNSGAREAVSGFRAGALDFLIKPFDDDAFLDALAKALCVNGERQKKASLQSDLAARVATLTQRERDVARKVAAGQTNQIIAEQLGIGLRTVKRYRQSAMEKLGAGGTAELVLLANQLGLTE